MATNNLESSIDNISTTNNQYIAGFKEFQILEGYIPQYQSSADRRNKILEKLKYRSN